MIIKVAKMIIYNLLIVFLSLGAYRLLLLAEDHGIGAFFGIWGGVALLISIILFMIEIVVLVWWMLNLGEED